MKRYFLKNFFYSTYIYDNAGCKIIVHMIKDLIFYFNKNNSLSIEIKKKSNSYTTKDKNKK